MARVISVASKQIISCSIITRFEDGTDTRRVIKVGDTVENLRYVENGEVKTVTGVVDAFTYRARSSSINSGKNAKDTFSRDVQVTNIILDASEQYNSNVLTIPVREIVEDEGVENVIKVDNVASPKLQITLTYSDGSVKESDIEPGDLVDAVVMNTKRGRPDITGRFNVLAFTYKSVDNAPVITGMALNNIETGRVTVTSLSRLISLDEIPTAKISDFSEISTFLSNAFAEGPEAALTLTGDIEVPKRDDGRITSTFINAGQKLTVDLAGHDFSTIAYAFYVNGGELIISDSTGEGKIETTVKNQAYPAVMVAAGKCTMLSGVVDVTNVELEEGEYNWTYGAVCSGEGVFDMQGGTIICDEASPISICNGTASGEGSQFIIGGDATLISKEGPAVYNADQRTVIIQDDAVVKGGIMARLGEIIIKDNAKVCEYRESGKIDSLGEFLPMSGSISVYGIAPIVLMGGCYTSQANSQDMSVDVLDDASIEASIGDGVLIVPLDTKIDQNITVNVENSKNVKVAGLPVKVLSHDEIMALAEEAGTASRINITKNSNINVVVDGEVIYPVVTETVDDSESDNPSEEPTDENTP